MSTILEALRKSERARRARQATVYGNAGEPSAPALLRWSSLLAGVALLAALVVFIWLLQRRPPELAMEATPEMQAEPETTARATPAPVTAAPVKLPAATLAPSVPATRPENRMEAARPPAVVQKPAQPSRPSVSVSRPGEPGLWSNLPEAERAGLPPLRVNIHVYTPDESQRILYIDNEPRVRGEEVAPGVFVDEIVPEGAIIRYRGQRYLLPRPA